MKGERLKEIILENENLIYSIIHKFRSRDYEDLFQAGCLGLIKAYKNFDSRSNIKFTSYAYNYILGEVYQYIVNNRNIHMSPMNVKLANSLYKAEDYLTNHLGRNPTTKELCEFLEIDELKLFELKSMISTDSIDYLDNLESVSLDKDSLIDLANALKCLNNNEKTLINASYYNNYTKNEIANLYNTNKVRISREEKRILCKLKAKMN